MRLTKDPFVVYRNARAIARINAVGTGILVVLDVMVASERPTNATDVGAFLAAWFFAMTLLAVWRVRRAARRMKTTELFSGR